MAGFFQLLAVLLTAATGWLVLQSRRRQLRDTYIAPTWRRLAESQGWQYHEASIGGARLAGSHDGYDFTARAQVEEGRIIITVPLRCPPEPGDALSVGVASFAEAAFLQALTAIVADAREADGAGEEEWSALAKLHGLALSVRGGERTLRGEIDGHSVRIGTQSDPTETIFRVRIGAPWLERVLIQPRGEGAERGVPTGNPILDSLVVVRAPDDPTIRAALSAPELAEDLLAVLLPYPRSSVVGGHVQMHCPGRLSEALADRLTDALTLASRLRADG